MFQPVNNKTERRFSGIFQGIFLDPAGFGPAQSSCGRQGALLLEDFEINEQERTSVSVLHKQRVAV